VGLRIYCVMRPLLQPQVFSIASPSSAYQMSDPDNGWKFAQCFGDKGDADDVTEGI
jgi:hypothetical protein